MAEVAELATAVLAGDYKEPVEDKPELTLVDRCDQCGAQAYVRVDAKAGDLLFCRHHHLAFATPLRDQGFEVTVDITEQLFS
jgi:hypothetical protein